MPEPAKLSEIARRAEITGTSWRSLSRFYALPMELSGLRVLDVCAGMSDSTIRLREAGALGVAVDVCYADLETMLMRNHRAFQVTARSVFGVEPETARGRELYKSLTEGFVAALESCPHVAASATALPFPDASFDLVISFNGIFGTLDYDAGALDAALREAIRVVRLGGSVQLVPYQQGPVLNDTERANQTAAVRALSRTNGIEVTQTIARSEAGMGPVGRLDILRTA